MFNNKRILRTVALAAAMIVVFAVFAFRAAEWTKGLSSEFIVYGQATTGSTGVGSTTKVIAQIAVGAYDSWTHYGTIIEIVNPNTSAITASGHSHNEDGSPSTLTFATSMASQPISIHAVLLRPADDRRRRNCVRGRQPDQLPGRSAELGNSGTVS